MQTKAFVHPGWFSSKMDQFHNFVMKKVTRGKMMKSFESETETTFWTRVQVFKSNSPFFPRKSHDLCPDSKGDTSNNDSETETSLD